MKKTAKVRVTRLVLDPYLLKVRYVDSFRCFYYIALPQIFVAVSIGVIMFV